MVMTDRQEELLQKLLQEVAALTATQVHLIKQNDTLNARMDFLVTESRSAWDEKADRLSQSVSNFGERLGNVEKIIGTIETRCSERLPQNEDWKADIVEKFEAHTASLEKLWKLENQRKGKITVMLAIGAFVGSIGGSLISAIILSTMR
jgi:hypothetical protein